MPGRGRAWVGERVITIDGARGEGGGQLLRTALALAAIQGIPVEIQAIRARRRSPGLQAQHLTAVSALAAICGGRVEGAHLGSERLAFWPGEPRAGEYRFEIGTAGAATLVLQAILPALARAPGASRVHLTGGTHVPWSPPADYLQEVLFPVLGQMGLRLGVSTARWGFYPKGAGEIVVEAEGRAGLQPLTRLRGPGPVRLRGISAVANLPKSIARRQAERALRRLEAAGYTAEMEEREAAALDPGSFLFLVAEGDGPLGGFSALGRRGTPAEQVADEAVNRFLEFARADAGCDPHLADQLVVPMALASGTSRLTTSAVTAHLRTVLDVVGQLLGCPAQLTGEEGGPGALTIQGSGAGDRGPGVADQGPGNGDRGPGTMHQGPEARDQGSETREQGELVTDIPHPATRCRVGNGFPGIPHSPPTPDPRSPVPAVRKARAADIPGMQRLLAHFATRGDVLPRTLNEMYQHIRDFFVCEQDGEIVGMVALFVYWEDLAEVRSLAVKEEAGGRGLGRALVAACLGEAAELGVRRVFALTNRPGFFARLGFATIDKRELPQKIWKDCIRCAKFAACDETALIREAGGEGVTRNT